MRKQLFLLLFLCISFSFAGDGFSYDFLDDLDLSFYVGETKIISVNNPTRIVIGKPELVDVVKATKEDITLIAKAQGETTLNWWDDHGEHTINIRVFEEQMAKIKKRIDKLVAETEIKGVTTTAFDSENKVVVKGELKSQDERESTDQIKGLRP